MKKKVLFLLISILSLMIFVGCGKKEEKDLVKEDLVNYLQNELPNISENKELAINTYNEVSNSDLSYDDLVSKFNDVILPSYKLFLDDLNNLEIATNELKEVKNIYYDACSFQYEAMKIVLEGLQNNDDKKLASADLKVEQSKEKMKEYENALQKLASEHNIVVNTSSETAVD